MWLQTGRSSSTNFRFLKKLKREGWITINAGEEDERTKWIEVSKLGLRYFSLHEKSMLKAMSKAA
jgi:DNA-binding MarR family transcriptional regulator